MYTQSNVLLTYGGKLLSLVLIPLNTPACTPVSQSLLHRINDHRNLWQNTERAEWAPGNIPVHFQASFAPLHIVYLGKNCSAHI